MRILLVEDSEDLADAIAIKLRREGHDVEHVGDGERGEDYAMSDGFDVVILDINLPKRDGFEVLSAIRHGGSRTPVLVMTARNQIADKVGLLDLGADDYIVKPCDLSEVAARVRALARRSSGITTGELVFGDLRLDMNNRAASLAGAPLELGRREYDMLEALAKAPGTPVNKEHVVVRLFGHDDAGTPNAVELLVSRLRKKLQGAQVEIVTQRGVGYILRQISSQR